MVYEKKIGVIGLGYVGLPLAVEFGKIRTVIGYDLNCFRIDELQNAFDRTFELSTDQLAEAKYLEFSSDPDSIKECQIYIVTVPTPIDDNKLPDLGPLMAASELVGSLLKSKDLVIYESTVYPGCTEEVCIPILEEKSGLKLGEFSCGYSPERINPGDKNHTLRDILKVTSGSSSEAATAVDELYKQIVIAGTYKVSSIKVAEAAKIIENTQRDLNIALVNELTMLFDEMKIDTEQVLKAAETKWNFISFRPGMVGGHCIGVDPYYLTYKAQQIGYDPKIILSGRSVNDGMAQYITKKCTSAITKVYGNIKGRVLVLGITFKENCPDIRNTKVVDVVEGMRAMGFDVDLADPWALSSEVEAEYGITLVVGRESQGRSLGSALTAKIFYDQIFSHKGYQAIILAVSHNQFKEIGIENIRKLGCEQGPIIYDLKYIFHEKDVDIRL